MWYSTILVAYDGSAPSDDALAVALDMANANPAGNLVLATVLSIPFEGGANQAVVSEETRRIERIEGKLEEAAKRTEQPVEICVLEGSSVADEILKCSHDHACDVIVMGSRGLGGLKGYLGSVSHAVVHESPCSVVIVK